MHITRTTGATVTTHRPAEELYEMTSWFQFLEGWLGQKTRNPASRLTGNQALEIARKAASGYPNCEDLAIVALKEQDGTPIWIVSSATIGRTLQVFIDDATGKVLEISQIGVR